MSENINYFKDYVDRAGTHCVALPVNLDYDKLHAWAQESATTVPSVVRLYFEEGFDLGEQGENFETIKNYIKNNFDDVNIIVFYDVPSKQIKAIQEFVHTHFHDWHTNDPKDVDDLDVSPVKLIAERKT